jgi:hypothetical protein
MMNIVVFLMIYFNMKSDFEIAEFIDAVFFSVILTTTIGFGDISPKTQCSKILVILHSVLNFITIPFLFS